MVTIFLDGLPLLGQYISATIKTGRRGRISLLKNSGHPQQIPLYNFESLGSLRGYILGNRLSELRLLRLRMTSPCELI
jgi:hypothetical protein